MSDFGTLQGQMISLLTTMHCLSEAAAERGDVYAGKVLHNAAALLEMSLIDKPLRCTQEEAEALRTSHAAEQLSHATT